MNWLRKAFSKTTTQTTPTVLQPDITDLVVSIDGTDLKSYGLPIPSFDCRLLMWTADSTSTAGHLAVALSDVPLSRTGNPIQAATTADFCVTYQKTPYTITNAAIAFPKGMTNCTPQLRLSKTFDTAKIVLAFDSTNQPIYQNSDIWNAMTESVVAFVLLENGNEWDLLWISTPYAHVPNPRGYSSAALFWPSQNGVYGPMGVGLGTGP
ncbi:MAG TPA: hypothetical protein VMD91_19225 [Candidatus Sulfotelmatobacter sp.]|nr:hypothetical protein [Candidatus Sulfotelmatobacter sp.]